MKRTIVLMAGVLMCSLFTQSLHAEPGVCPLEDESDPAQVALWETVTSTVKIKHALMITSTKVVNDRTRTYDACDTSAAGTGIPGGKWTFGYIMRKLAGSQDVSAFTLNWLNTWASDTTLNGFSVPKRPNISSVINSWPRLPNSTALDVDRAPFRLTAIVNRVDLSSFSSTSNYSGSSGEGRLIFNWYNPQSCSTLQQFNVIFEFKLPAKFSTTVSTNSKQWASYWNTLSANEFSDFPPDYRTKLQEITDAFISAANLGQVRSNEIALGAGAPWELREFKLTSPNNGQLKLFSTALTPNDTKNNTQELVNFLNTNSAGIIAGTVSASPAWQGGRSIANNDPSGAWGKTVASQINDLEARHVFALNTCNGCHTTESGTCFTHVMPRKATAEAAISPFLRGSDINVFDFHNPADPVTTDALQFNELDCRALDSYDMITGTTNGGLRTTSSGNSRQADTGALHTTSDGARVRIPRSSVH